LRGAVPPLTALIEIEGHIRKFNWEPLLPLC
jgi:hypothetical protein